MLSVLILLSSHALTLAQQLPEDKPIKLISFDGHPSWTVMNDPVMGGQSHSAYHQEAGSGIFSGVCAIVPFLKAPGFCKIASKQGLFKPTQFPDASSFIGGALHVEVRSTTPDYDGFKIAFAAKNTTRPRPGMHHAAPSFKADFRVPSGSQFTNVRIPFSKFSVDWSEFTGECDTKDPTGEQHLCCSAAHPEVCPQDYHLRQLLGFEVWAEGKEGKFQLELQRISAGP